MTQPRHIRIFLSSPGDVADERALALQVFVINSPDRAQAVRWFATGFD